TLCAFAYGLARGRPAAARWSLRFLMVMAALAVLNLALQYFPATQDNGRWIAFFLPWWCGLSLGTWLILRRPTASTSASQPNSLGPPARRED
ncbi:MAG TPA: hypothetical protein VGL13_06070, partial [Polyangiaceae bacterium]